MDVTTDWFWEGNVVNARAHSLSLKGWIIDSQADTHSKERGVDLRASSEGRILLVEAKGYPSTSYRDPSRADEKKPTNPTNQAQQWYSHALLKVLWLKRRIRMRRSLSLFQIFLVMKLYFARPNWLRENRYSRTDGDLVGPSARMGA